MKHLWPLIVGFSITLFGMTIFTQWSIADGESTTRVCGMPVLAFGAEKPAWIAFGGFGVLVLGAGAGVVVFGLAGAGLLIGTGQLAVGFIALGQLGLGFILFLGQVGLGLHVGAQGGGGARSWTQGSSEEKPYFLSMWKELTETIDPKKRDTFELDDEH